MIFSEKKPIEWRSRGCGIEFGKGAVPIPTRKFPKFDVEIRIFGLWPVEVDDNHFSSCGIKTSHFRKSPRL